MRDGTKLNPLVNPVLSGDDVKIGETVYRAETGMNGLWNVYHDDRMVAQGIPSQVELCRWFDSVARTL